MTFHFLYTMVDIFKGYFEDDFDEDALRDNFTLVYELLDEMLDFGYPQVRWGGAGGGQLLRARGRANEPDPLPRTARWTC